MKYNTVKLGDYLYIKGRIGWKGLKKDEYLEKSDYRIINGESLTADGIDWDTAGYITKERYEESPEIMLQPNDILLSKDGTIGKIGFVEELEYPTTVASGIFVIRNLQPNIINTRFIYNYLCSTYFKNFITMRTEGSVIPHLYQKDFVDLDFPLPSMEVQNKIVKILDDIFYKIDTNKKINSNLFEQANTLFYNYIIVPSNLEKSGTLGDYCDVKSGYAFKSAWWTTSGVKVIKIKTIEGDALNLNECSYVSPDKSDYAKDFSVVAGDVLIAMTGATIGKLAIVPYLDEEILVNQRVGRFFLGDNPIEKLPFLYCSLKQNDIIADIINKGQGSAQPNISGNDILTTPCYLPASNEINEFNQLCKPYFETILRNQRQNIELANIRDTLLPKLMSGEIDLSSIEI